MSLQVEDLVSYTGARSAPMKRLLFALLVAGALVSPAPVLSERLPAEGQQPRVEAAVPSRLRPSHAPAAPVFGPPSRSALVKQYCTGCHSDRGKAGQLSLASFDAAAAANPDHVATTEKMIRKLRAGMMPPASARRPAAEQITALADRARGAHRSRRARQSQSRLASVPAPQSRRIRRAR